MLVTWHAIVRIVNEALTGAMTEVRASRVLDVHVSLDQRTRLIASTKA